MRSIRPNSNVVHLCSFSKRKRLVMALCLEVVAGMAMAAVAREMVEAAVKVGEVTATVAEE